MTAGRRYAARESICSCLIESDAKGHRNDHKTRLPVRGSAVLSPCEQYRYVLEREWDAGLPVVLFIALNPSTADAANDDATVRRCIGFARTWGFGKLVIANLFALRSSDPSVLVGHVDPIGPGNDEWLVRLSSSYDLTIAAWGVHGVVRDRAAEVLPKLRDPHHLGLTLAGHPRHPLYLPATTMPIKLAANCR